MIHDQKFIALILTIVGLCLFNKVSAQTPIHKCTDADGNVAYSQLPCVVPKLMESEEPEQTEAVEETESTPPDITETPKDQPERDTNTSACKKRYRDAIDVIDAEIGREYSAEKAAQFKQRLLQLTRKLRQC